MSVSLKALLSGLGDRLLPAHVKRKHFLEWYSCNGRFLFDVERYILPVSDDLRGYGIQPRGAIERHVTGDGPDLYIVRMEFYVCNDERQIEDWFNFKRLPSPVELLVEEQEHDKVKLERDFRLL